MPARQQTSPPGGAKPLPRDQYARLLDEARARTAALVEPVSEHDMERVHNPLMSPLVWDIGHIAAFEDLWLCQHLGKLEPLRPDLAEVYDAAETPRKDRGNLPFLHLSEAWDYMAEVRARTLSVIERYEGDEFIWEMVLQHEQQHNETMLQALQLAPAGVYKPPSPRLAPSPEGDVDGSERLLVEAGPFLMGDPGQSFAYDNERPQHEVSLPAFEIDRWPVTVGAYREFVEDGAYSRREWWSDEGWFWIETEGVKRPLYWTDDGGQRFFDSVEPLDESLPVIHVSFFEAEAYARYRGRRLPSEAEWEKAAAWDPDRAAHRRHPWGDSEPDWGRANLDHLSFRPDPVGAHAAGASAYGVGGLEGDCWEWTSTAFGGYSGFRAYPYAEYSEIFFDGCYRVLRGGSWATRPRVVRTTFRNWDFPQRRQIFSGFRCANDAES